MRKLTIRTFLASKSLFFRKRPFLVTLNRFVSSLSEVQSVQPTTSLIDESDVAEAFDVKAKSFELLESVKVASVSEVANIEKVKSLLPIVDRRSEEMFETVCKEIGLEKSLKAMVARKELDLNNLNVVAGFFGVKFITEQSLVSRKPVVCIMGHVDHGKTTLLDHYRSTRKAASEVGGITQKIGGFTMETAFGPVSFIDTPGHAIFSNMRKTGVLLADIVVLIVSAVEGVQPQTEEALELIRRHKLPFVVAINKIDVSGSDPESAEEGLVELGVELEPYGGNVPVVHISAKNGRNTDLLLELLVEESRKLDLKADEKALPECLVLETTVQQNNDLKRTSVLVKNGTVRVGSYIVFGSSYFKVMRLSDDLGRVVSCASPGDIVELGGVTEYPGSAERLFGCPSEGIARLRVQVSSLLKEKFNREEVDMVYNDFKVKFKNWRERRRFGSSNEFRKEKLRESLDLLDVEFKEASQKGTSEAIDEIERKRKSLHFVLGEFEDQKMHNPIVIKVSNVGTRDTVKEYLSKVDSKGFTVVDVSCGPITEHDVALCRQTGAKVITFDLQPTEEAQQLLRDSGVTHISHNIIYKLFDDLATWKSAEDLPNASGSKRGNATVKKVFSLADEKNRKQQVAGIKVDEGSFSKNGNYKVIRKGKVIASNLKVVSLRRFKEEVSLIAEGQEGGIAFYNFDKYTEGDVIESQ